MTKTSTPGERMFMDAADRNRHPILEVLRATLPARGIVLEIASGSGQHAVHFAANLPGITWQPSERDPGRLASVERWRLEAGPPNLRPAIELDVTAVPWPIEAADAIVNINMVHVAPWSVTLALLDGARRILGAGAPLYLYGPYRRHGAFTTPSNAAFDASLRERNPEWGLKDLEALEAAAAERELALERVVDMPANNFSVIFRRRAA